MKWVIVLIISTFALNPVKAYAVQETLARYCETHTSRTLDPALQDLFDRYPDTASRAANPQGFVADMDRVIARQPYSQILSCREQVPYVLSFIPVENGLSQMYVAAKYTRDGELSRVEMFFDLNKPTAGVYFNYLHELQHVCQKYNSQQLIQLQYREYAKLTPVEKLYYSTRDNAHTDGKSNPDFQKIYDEVRRLNYIGEVEAFHVQFVRFRQTVETSSPGLCASGNLWTYLATEQDLIKGRFAQNIISSYLGDTPNNDPAFFVPDSSLVEYYDQGTSTRYKMRRLNSAMVQAITQMGITYIHP